MTNIASSKPEDYRKRLNRAFRFIDENLDAKRIMENGMEDLKFDIDDLLEI